jgi:hypothetical protein
MEEAVRETEEAYTAVVMDSSSLFFYTTSVSYTF